MSRRRVPRRRRSAWRSGPAAVIVLFAAAGLFGPALTNGRERATDLGNALAGPSAHALLGTDQLGRDELSRVLAGARGSVIAVGVALLACLLVGGVLGVLAGWHGGIVDRLLLRLVDVVTGVPTLLLGLVLAAALGGSSWNVAVALAATQWPPYVRVIRTETRLRRDDPSNQALLLLGAGPVRILTRHVAPALSGPIAVLLGITAAEVLLSVATLSYLGLGARPPVPEWGSMLVESGPYLSSAPWLFLAPAVAVTAVALSATLLAGYASSWFTHGISRPHPPGPARTRVAKSTVVFPPMPPDEVCVQIRELTVDILGDEDTRVVDSVSLSVDKGQTLAIAGPSGSGKTMAMLGVLGLFPPAVSAAVGGSVRLNGHELVGLGEKRLRAFRGRIAAYVPQDTGSALNPLRRVGAQIAGVARRHLGLDRAAAASRAAELLTQVGIDDPARVAHQRPGELSGGMRQRVLLAMALAGQPDLLIADEPTSSLDVTTAVQIVELLGQLQRRLGMAMIIITHELGVAVRLASRIAVFDHGRAVEVADVNDLLAGPTHPVSRQLITAAGLSGPPPVDRPRPPRRPPAARPLLEVRDLQVTFPGRGRRSAVTALTGINLRLRTSEVVGVVGSSGSGKSTLARALAGIEPHTSGTVLLGGRPVDPRQRRVQLVFQDPSAALDRRQTVADALAEALRLSGVRHGAVARRGAALLRLVRLTPEHGQRRPWQLSGGERQRAVIARCLAGDPDLLVLDEPVSALDSVHRIEITDVLRALRDGGLAMVLISHDLGVVEQLADRVVVMSEGRIVDELKPGARVDERSHRVTLELADAREYFRMNRPLSGWRRTTDGR
ncbi:MAG: ATP-binding cassette domain-containing protein [Pseudonocardiaceae bacterium]